MAFFAHIGGFVAGMLLIGFSNDPRCGFCAHPFPIVAGLAVARERSRRLTHPTIREPFCQIMLTVGLLQNTFIHPMTHDRVIRNPDTNNAFMAGCCNTSRLANSRPPISPRVLGWLTVRWIGPLCCCATSKASTADPASNT